MPSSHVVFPNLGKISSKVSVQSFDTQESRLSHFWRFFAFEDESLWLGPITILHRCVAKVVEGFSFKWTVTTAASGSSMLMSMCSEACKSIGSGGRQEAEAGAGEKAKPETDSRARADAARFAAESESEAGAEAGGAEDTAWWIALRSWCAWMAGPGLRAGVEVSEAATSAAWVEFGAGAAAEALRASGLVDWQRLFFCFSCRISTNDWAQKSLWAWMASLYTSFLSFEFRLDHSLTFRFQYCNAYGFTLFKSSRHIWPIIEICSEREKAMYAIPL